LSRITEATRIERSTRFAFADWVYVLHVFQKKSNKGSATPQADIELVRQRLKRAVELHKQREH
jgi:phage-related protein